MKSRKFGELKVGDTIYFCNCRAKFNKENILDGSSLKVKTIHIDKIKHRNNFIFVEDYEVGRCIPFKKSLTKIDNHFFTYSTSKDFIEKRIKQSYNSYIKSLKEKIKDGKKAEKDLNELMSNHSLKL